jgi:hypothetical protein
LVASIAPALDRALTDIERNYAEVEIDGRGALKDAPETHGGAAAICQLKTLALGFVGAEMAARI